MSLGTRWESYDLIFQKTRKKKTKKNIKVGTLIHIAYLGERVDDILMEAKSKIYLTQTNLFI